MAANFQSWAVSGEYCPEGTVPVRRTTEEDVLRASSVRRFAKKPTATFQRDASSSGHEVRKKPVILQEKFKRKNSGPWEKDYRQSAFSPASRSLFPARSLNRLVGLK